MCLKESNGLLVMGVKSGFGWILGLLIWAILLIMLLNISRVIDSSRRLGIIFVLMVIGFGPIFNCFF